MKLMDRVDILENDLIRIKREIAQRRHKLEDEQEELLNMLKVEKSKAKAKSIELDSPNVCNPLVSRMGVSAFIRYRERHRYDDKYALGYNYSLDTSNDCLQHQLDKCTELIIKFGKVVLP